MHPLKKYMKNEGIKNKDLADKVGTTPIYISRIKGYQRYPGRKLLEKLVKETGLSADDFLFKTPTPAEPLDDKPLATAAET